MHLSKKVASCGLVEWLFIRPCCTSLHFPAALLPCRFAAPWHFCLVYLPCCSTSINLVSKCLSALLSWWPAALLPCSLLLCYPAVLLPCCPVPCSSVTLLLCYPAALLLCYPAALLPCCLLSCCSVTLLPICPAALLLSYPASYLPCCPTAYLQCCPTAYLPCCPTAYLPCCPSAAHLPCCPSAAHLPCCHAALLPIWHAAFLSCHFQPPILFSNCPADSFMIHQKKIPRQPFKRRSLLCAKFPTCKR